MTGSRPAGADMRPLAYRINVAAEMIGIGKSKMWEIIAAKRVPTRKIDGATIVLRSDLEEFLASLPIVHETDGESDQ